MKNIALFTFCITLFLVKCAESTLNYKPIIGELNISSGQHNIFLEPNKDKPAEFYLWTFSQLHFPHISVTYDIYIKLLLHLY